MSDFNFTESLQNILPKPKELTPEQLEIQKLATQKLKHYLNQHHSELDPKLLSALFHISRN